MAITERCELKRYNFLRNLNGGSVGMQSIHASHVSLKFEELTSKGIEQYLSAKDGPDHWREIVRAECLTIFAANGVSGTLVSDDSGKPLAASFGGFLTTEFSDLVMNNGCEWVNALARRRLIEGLSTVVPTPERNAASYRAEARTGLHLHYFMFDWEGDISGDRSLKLRTALALDLLDRYVGAPIRMLTVEAIGQYVEEGVRGGFRVQQRNLDRGAALLVADQTSELQVTNPWFMALFRTGKHQVKLSDRQRRILYFCMRGLSDDEIAFQVGLSVKSMKTYWDRIYTAFEEVLSFSGCTNKKRLVQTHLRLQPEEAWPR